MSGPKYNEEKQKKEEYWCVEGSDDEKYDPSKSGKGLWEPSAEDILKLFEKLEKTKVLELQWKCPGRRPPGSEKENDGKDIIMEDKEEEMNADEEEKKPEQPTEFDFDDDEFSDISNPITPRRTPGTKTPKSQKKVATMDKVLKNMMIERKKEARKLSKSHRTPQSIHRPKMGTPPISSNFGQGQKLTPLRPPTMSDAPPVRNLSMLSDKESQSNVKSDTKNIQTPGNSHTEDVESVKTKTEDKGT